MGHAPGMRKTENPLPLHDTSGWAKKLNFDHRRLANMLRRDPNYKGGPIRLLSCYTGKLPNGAAQNLANKLGVEVLGPNDIVWAFEDGTLTIGQIPGVNSGTFEVFQPGNVNLIVGGIS